MLTSLLTSYAALNAQVMHPAMAAIGLITDIWIAVTVGGAAKPRSTSYPRQVRALEIDIAGAAVGSKPIEGDQDATGPR